MTEIPIGESQNVEYKEAWRDDFLAWICGFANAQGGMLTTIPRGNEGDDPINDPNNGPDGPNNGPDDTVNGPEQVNEQVNSPDDTVNDTVNSSNDTVNDTVNLSEIEICLIKILKGNPYATYAQLGAQLTKSRATIIRIVNKLREENILIRHGSDKTGYWEVVEQKHRD